MKKTFFAAMLLFAFVAYSCTPKEEVTPSDKSIVNDGSLVFAPTATIEDFVFDGPATKTTVAFDGDNAPEFTFEASDILGVYPYTPQQGDQVRFKVKESSTAWAAFDGQGFGLKSGQYYAAYYPADIANAAAEKMTAIPVDYTGQRQTGKTTYGIAKADYLVANNVTPENNACSFSMHHVGALLVMDITFPEAGNYNAITLTSEATPFVVDGTMDLTAEVIAVEAEGTAATVTLALGEEGGSGLAIAAGETVRFCMMVAPANLKNSKVTLAAGSGSVEFASFKEFKAGKAYKVTCTLGQEAPAEPTNLSENGTANSYIVDVDNINAAGYYFDCTVAGNGQEVDMASQNYTTHANVWPKVNGTYTSALPVGGSVRIPVNQNNCITDVVFDATTGTISFKATGVKGNAKIQLRDAANDDPAWIWHIWCTDQPGTVTVTDASSWGYSYDFMDRNMGALTNDVDASNPANMYGLYYQFGNPTGFTWEEFANSNSGGWRMVDGIAGYPTRPFHGPDWYWFNPYGASNANQFFGLLWGGGSAGNGTLKRGPAAIKTMYDPCPPGYKITPLDFIISASDAGGNVWGWYKNGTNGTIFFPYNGSVVNGGSEVTGPYDPVEDSAVWTVLWTSGHNNRNMAYRYHIYAKGENRAGGGEVVDKVLAYGCGVRCVAE